MVITLLQIATGAKIQMGQSNSNQLAIINVYDATKTCGLAEKSEKITIGTCTNF